MQWRSVALSRCAKSSSNRLSSSRHLFSTTSGLGQITRIESSFWRACSSLMMSPASIVLPTPTSSAMRRRGRSALISFMTGRYWYGSYSIRPLLRE